MGLFGGWFDDEDAQDDYDFESLRRDLESEYAAQSATFSGGFGFCQMMEASDASDEELLKMAKREGINLNKYRK